MELVKILESYNRSTSLELDFEDSSKLKNIVLTHKFKQGTFEVLETINNENSNQRVRVLSGSPGLGKSTFALFISNLVSHSNDKAISSILNLKHAKDYCDKDLDSELGKFNKSKKTLLPVFLNGYQGNIETVFVEKLADSFDKIGQRKILDKIIKQASSNFSDVITKWEGSASPLYSLYVKELKKRKLDQAQFETALRKSQKLASAEFEEIYYALMGEGLDVNFSSNDVIQIYKTATKELKNLGYNGIFVIYDEFGKFLEKGVQNPSLLNFQFLQDFAEYCDRSGKDQVHLTLITHLSVSQYASQLPISIQKEWAKIEGRFHENSFYDRQTNYYDLIAKVFSSNIDSTAPKLFKMFKAEVNEFVLQFKKSKLEFNELIERAESSISKCYPLHPTSLILLPLLSQKVAQNERTLYTFLTRNEDMSLKKFISTEVGEKEINYLSPSYLFEYFSPLIAKDIGVGGSYKVNLITEEAFSKISSKDKTSKEIISLLALISVIKTVSSLVPSSEFIQLSLKGIVSENEVKKSIQDLEIKKIIYFNKILGQYELFEGSSIDLQEEINKQKNTKLTSRDLVKLIKSYHPPGFITPKKYNAENAITRFYRVDYLSVEELKIKKNFSVDYQKEDGLLNYVFVFDKEELNTAKKILLNNKDQLSAFVLPFNYIEAKKDIEELSAVNSLFGNKDIVNSSPLVKKELNRYRDILVSSIAKLVKPLIGEFQLESELYYNGEKTKISHHSSMQRRLGDIFEMEYNSYFKFNNEMLNKHKVSGNITLARKQLIDAIIQDPSVENFGLDGNGPQVTIGKVAKNSSKMSFDGEKIVFKDKNFLKLRDAYSQFLMNSEKGASVSDLISYLISPPFGLRKGVLPLYISLFDKSFNQPVNHYFDGTFITTIDGEHYELILKHPNNCKIYYKEMSQAQVNHLKELGRAFEVTSVSGVTDVLEGVLNFRKKITEYVKNSESLSLNSRKLLIEIDTAKEPDKLLLESIPMIYINKSITSKTDSSDIAKCMKLLENSKKEIFEHYPILVKELNSTLIEKLNFIRTNLLGKNAIVYVKGMNLAKMYQEALGELPENVRNHPFNSLTAKFIGRIKNFDSSLATQYFIETVGEALTNSTPRYWDKKGKALFEHSIVKCLEEIELTCEFLNDKFNGVSAIAFISREDNKKEFVRLGTTSTLREDLFPKRQKVEILLEGLSQKDRNDLLLNLLSSNEAKNIGKKKQSLLEGIV